MAKLQKGTTFVNSTTYQASDLNNLVDNALILPGAITEQTAGTPSSSDQFLFYSVSNSALRQCTLSDLIAGIPTDGAANVGCLRTLGTSPSSAAAGNDSRFPAVLTGIRLANGSGNPDTAAGAKDFAFDHSLGTGGGTLAVDWDTADVFRYNLTSNATFTFSNVRSGRVITILVAPNGHTVTWPALSGATPALSANSWTAFTFVCSAGATFGVSAGA